MNAENPAEIQDDALTKARKEKTQDWRGKGVNPYPTAEGFKPKHQASAIHKEFDEFTKEQLEEKRMADPDRAFSVAGRVMLHRSFGKSTFLTIQDRTGRIQIFAQSKKLPAEVYDMVKHLDLGDIIFVEGSVFKTKTGELTIDAAKLQLLTKNIRPLPEKFHGLQDVEARYRQRYLDLLTNQDVKKVFRIRSELIKQMRNFFYERDYLEVETPMLHPLVGGAAARPFKTFHNTLKMDLFLRIAPELYLKRLVVGGLDRVFEINRCFRNEGISIKHNPEFTMLEFYEAYATYEDLMELTEDLLEKLCHSITGSNLVDYQGTKISFKKPFKRLTVLEAIKEHGQVDPNDEKVLADALSKTDLKIKGTPGLTELQWLFFEEFVEDKLIQPTFITELPISVSPLARKNEKNESVAERFELFVAGREIANGFNELNDPEDQRSRFLDQLKKKQAGDEEATDYDEDYIEALEVGLPPTAGEGIGIDRLAMLFTDSASIRDVILFPQLRSQKPSPVQAES